MRTIRPSSVRGSCCGLGALLAVLGLAGACGAPLVDHPGAARSPLAASELRSQRRLVYMLAPPVVITAQPSPSVGAGLPHELRTNVAQDMRELGLEVDRNPNNGHDLTVHLSASIQAVGQLTRARAAMYITADGQLLEQIDSAEIIEAPARMGSALARDLVARLARSPRAAEYADALYGRRLRPLRDTVGRHARGREEPGTGMPPGEMLVFGAPATSDPTLRGRAELSPPAAPDARDQVAARDNLLHGRALLDAGRTRDAYVAFEQAYLLDDNAEPLFGLAESLLRTGARQDALIFYRAYLHRAEPGSPAAARAVAQVGAIEGTPAAPRAQ
jgi:tetratricopeptide (TPR) repeat protein